MQRRHICTWGFLGPQGPWGSRVLWADPELRQLQALASPAPTLHCPCALVLTDCTGWAGWETLGLYFNDSTFLVPTATIFLHSFQNEMSWVSLVFSCQRRNRKKKKSVNCAKTECQALPLPLQWKCWLVISFSHLWSALYVGLQLFLIQNVNSLFSKFYANLPFLLYVISFFGEVFKNLKYLFYFSHSLSSWFAFSEWKSVQPFPCCLGNSSQGFHQVNMSARSSFRCYPKTTEDSSIRTALVWNPSSYCKSSRQGMKRRQDWCQKARAMVLLSEQGQSNAQYLTDLLFPPFSFQKI